MQATQHQIGLRLFVARTAQNWTLAQVAEASGLSMQYVSNLEHGRGNPTIGALRGLAEVLDVTLAEVVALPEELELLRSSDTQEVAG